MWYVYILLCNDNSYYIGSTDNIERRYKDHQRGHGGFYTAKHKALKILYTETYLTYDEVRKREAQLKKWSRAKKKALVNGNINMLKKL